MLQPSFASCELLVNVDRAKLAIEQRNDRFVGPSAFARLASALVLPGHAKTNALKFATFIEVLAMCMLKYYTIEMEKCLMMLC